jgi:flagellar protein FliJ
VTRRFDFRLERVRALRESREELAKEALAESLSLRLKGEAMLAEASAIHSQAQAARRESAQSPAVGGAELVAMQAYLERVERARQAAELELNRHDAEVDARRTVLRAAAQERQVLERLKERKRCDHQRALERHDAQELDEVGLAIHRRARSAR